MPFDPNWPPANAEIESAPFRNQFNSLNDLITGLNGSLTHLTDQVSSLPTNPEMDQDINLNSAGPVTGLALLNLTVGNPPTQAQMQAIANKVDELIALLQRP